MRPLAANWWAGGGWAASAVQKVFCSAKRPRAEPQRSALCRRGRHKNCCNEMGAGAKAAELEKPPVT